MADVPAGKRSYLLALPANTQLQVTFEVWLPLIEVTKESDTAVWFTSDGSDVVIPAPGQATTAVPVVGAVGSVQLRPDVTNGAVIKVKSAAAATVYLVDPGR